MYAYIYIHFLSWNQTIKNLSRTKQRKVKKNAQKVSII